MMTSKQTNQARAVVYCEQDMICMCMHGTGRKAHASDAEKTISANEVFENASPAMALRGFRGKNEWTQQELAEKLGTTQNHVADMECGKCPVSLNFSENGSRDLGFAITHG